MGLLARSHSLISEAELCGFASGAFLVKGTILKQHQQTIPIADLFDRDDIAYSLR